MAFHPVVRLPPRSDLNLSTIASAFIVAAAIIAFLHIGREILLPLVIATLLAFILSPVIRRLRGLGLWNGPSVDHNGPTVALDARLVCVSYFGAQATPTHMRYLIRRLKRLMPHARFLAGFWMLANEATKLEEWRTIVGADFACGTLVEATAICMRAAMQGEDRNLPPPTSQVIPLRAALASDGTKDPLAP